MLVLRREIEASLLANKRKTSPPRPERSGSEVTDFFIPAVIFIALPNSTTDRVGLVIDPQSRAVSIEGSLGFDVVWVIVE